MGSRSLPELQTLNPQPSTLIPQPHFWNPKLNLSSSTHPDPLPRPPQVNEGVVLAVGPGRRTRDGELISPSVKEGDKVLLPEFGGSLVKLNDKE